MINLDKQHWKYVYLGDICKIQYGSSVKSTDNHDGYKTFRMNEIINGLAVDNGEMKKTKMEESGFTKYKLNNGDILFNRTNSFEHVGRTGIFLIENGDYIFASYLLRLSVDEKKINPLFLNSLMNSNWFQTDIKHYATKAVGQANINATSLSNYEIPLPPLDEQQRIVELFQSIEQNLDHTERQEENLKTLQKTLGNGLVSKEPVFGNLLSARNCTPCLFGNLCDCIEQHCKTPLENGLEHFIGLENIESGNFTLQGFGNIEDGTTFTKCFSKGDVLFGKRRAYLKKVAVADFDGICSSDILVFRAKLNAILPNLLPYYASSDAFMDHAVSTSAGSLSPRTKWKDLAGFKLSIPDIKTQEKIIDVFSQLSISLQRVYQQKENLKNLKQRLLNEILGG